MDTLFSDTLKKYWGYGSFRPGQLDVIRAVYSGTDTLALMPTGAGKSILYQVPALSKDGVCVVVTPLIALMKDQVDRLRSLRIPAAAIHSGLTRRQIDIILDNAAWGDTKFLFISPERIPNHTFRERIKHINVNLITVDEAHCISHWGYDFRPHYLKIGLLRELLPDVPVLALTASATPVVADDILNRLSMTSGKVIRSGFERPNISFSVRDTDDKQGMVLRVLKNVPGTAIVYVRTRARTVELAEFLTSNDIACEYYHGGMGHAERNLRQQKWIEGKTRVMVSTNAFGMGIDKADVRVVVHYDVCDSLEAYYQEAGRAGRDGRISYAVLLSASDDIQRARMRFDAEFAPIEKIKECYAALFDYLQIGYGDGKNLSFAFNIHDFSSKSKIYTGTAHNAIKILQQNGYMTLTDDTNNPPRIKFIVGRDDLYKIRINRAELDHFLRTILRLYEGLFGDRLIAVDIEEIAANSGYTVDKVRELMKKLWQLHIIKYVPANRSPLLYLHEDRLPVEDVYISPESYRIRKIMARQRMAAMHNYLRNTDQCRSRLICHYFGDDTDKECGGCDVCITKKKRQVEQTAVCSADPADNISEIIYELLSHSPLTVRQIVGMFAIRPDVVIGVIDKLAADGKINHTDNGKVTIKR